MYNSFTLNCKLVGYDTIVSEKNGQKNTYLKIYLINMREPDPTRGQVGSQVLELFEPLKDWEDIIKLPDFKPGCNFAMDGYFSDFKYRPLKFLGIEKGGK